MKDILNYVLDNFSLYYDCDRSLISYGKKSDSINISNNNTSGFFEGDMDIDPQNVVWKKWKDRNIPFLFDGNGDPDIISLTDDSVSINYDIIASAFYFLSGWNERFAGKDELGRILYTESMIAQLDLSELPVVNYYFDILKTAFEKVSKISSRSLWDDHDMAVVLTHDIDTCRTGWLEDSFDCFKKRKLFTPIKLVLQRLVGKDTWFNFDEISRLEKKYDARSSFYFLARKGRAGKQKNADYHVRSPKIRKAIAHLVGADHEIGIHGSFGTHTEAEGFIKDLNSIPVPIIKGNRFHYLMWDNDRSADILERARIKYDTTLGFSEHIGFRRGTCYPFFLYDLENERATTVLEIPLIVMDATLKQARYMGLDKEDILPRIQKILKEVRQFNGVLALLWHNNYFSTYKFAGWGEIYDKILTAAREHNAYLSDGYTVYEKIVT